MTPTLSPRPAALVFALLLPILALSVTGCPRGTGPDETLPLLTTDDPVAEGEIRRAREAADAGRSEEAEQLYRAFLTQHPDDPLVPIAQLGLGRLLLAEGEPDRALVLFDQVAAHSDEAVSERGRFYRGVALHLQGDHAGALALLRPLRGRTVDPAETTLLLRTLAAAALQSGDHQAAVEALDGLLDETVPADDRDEAAARLAEVVQHELQPEERRSLYESLPRDGHAWPLVAETELRQAFERGDLARVRTVAEDLDDAGRELPPELAVMAMRAERTGTANPRVIGAVLPLSGRGREAGLAVLRGLSLAAGSPPTGPLGEDAFQLVHRDSEGDPAVAAAAVDELVTMHRVVAIVGPIGAEATRRAAARAQDLGVPLIALSPLDGIERTGDMVFRGLPTPDDEARALVRRAIAAGHRRVAVMHPEHAYGVAVRDAARAAVEGTGGDWAGAVSYEPGATSFGDQVNAVRAMRPDALVVADTGATVQVIAPSLAAVGLWSVREGQSVPDGARALPVFLPSVALGRGLLRNAGRYLQGATISLPFHAGEAGPARDFQDAYEARFGTAPPMLAAHAFDVFAQLEAHVEAGAATREALAAALPSDHPNGATASRGFTATRSPRIPTRLYVLEGDNWRSLED